jgi:hypothetical protein
VTAAVRDARPPLWVVRVLNVVLRRLLRTPIARFIDAPVLLEFDGRRTGRRLRVPVGRYAIDEGWVVFTPAPWRVNFATAAPAVVRHRGRRHVMSGTLVTDPAATARAIDDVLASGASTRFLAVDVAQGHRITAQEVTELGTAMVILQPLSSSPLDRFEPVERLHRVDGLE